MEPECSPLCRQPLPGQESNAAILFLDIDGVVIKNRDSEWLSEKIEATLGKLFIKKPDCHNAGFTELEWRTAAAHHLFKIPLENLYELIDKVQSVRPFYIVLCSQWRNDGTLEQIINMMFAMHPKIANLIIGKTPPRDYERRFPPENNYSFETIAKEQFNIELRNRADQIDFWKKYHHMEWADFAILDDYDNGLSKKFPNHFVNVNPNELFTKEDVELALKILKIKNCEKVHIEQIVRSLTSGHKAISSINQIPLESIKQISRESMPQISITPLEQIFERDSISDATQLAYVLQKNHDESLLFKFQSDRYPSGQMTTQEAIYSAFNALGNIHIKSQEQSPLKASLYSQREQVTNQTLEANAVKCGGLFARFVEKK